MKNVRKNSLGARVVSGLLSAMMIISACPVNAYAAYNTDNIMVEDVVLTDENLTEPVETEDENVGSIPPNETAENQTEPEVSTPPNIEDESTTVEETSEETNSEETTTVEETESTEEEAISTEAETEDVTEEETVEETTEENITEEYNVILPEDVTLTVGDSYVVNADITKDDETVDISEEYTLEWLYSDDISAEDISDTSVEFTFNKEGEYTIECIMQFNEEELASDEIIITVEKDLPIVIFDHYFSTIDESLVETSDLMVTTDDSSVFTKNTNVVSNFDNAYIISCTSVQEAKYVYSYYVDKVDTITDLSKVISIATEENDNDVADLTDINDGNDALSNLNDINIKDYSGYIALIDTGANADVNFSVVGDDTSDSNGHGTKMYNLIKTENPNAKVMSIKVFNGNTTDAASLYAGIMLAIESKVSVINLSLVGSDIEKNAIVKDAIQEAINNGITVIGAAGNYNVSATKFIPGCIDGAIIIGAANEDGSKYSTSNYDADYYVVANSTSEATAIYTGLYTANKLDDPRISDGEARDSTSPEPDEESDAYLFAKNLAEALGTNFWMEEDGTYTVAVDKFDFETQASAQETNFTDDKYAVANLHNVKVGDEYNGTCTITKTGLGEGTASGFGGGNLFSTIMSGKSLYCSCERYWENTTDSKGAPELTGSVYYKATVTSVKDEGAKHLVTFSVLFSDNQNNFGKRSWKYYKSEFKWVPYTSESHSVQYGKQCSSCNTTHWAPYPGNYGCPSGQTAVTVNDPYMRIIATVSYTVTYTKTDTSNGTVVETSNLGGGTETANSGMINNPGSDQGRSAAITDQLTKAKGAIAEKIPDKIKHLIRSSGNGFSGVEASNISDITTGTTSATQTWRETSDHQIYKAKTTLFSWNYIYLKVTKQVNDSIYGDIVDATSAYTLDGATISIYKDSAGTNILKDADGHNCTFEVTGAGNNKSASKTFTLKYEDCKGINIYAKETKTGFGYAWDGGIVHSKGKLTSTGGGITEISMDNIPLYDPDQWAIVKMEDTTGDSYKVDIVDDIEKPIKANWQGDIIPVNAEYTVKQYQINKNGEKIKNKDPENVWVYKTDDYGEVKFDVKSYCKSTKKPPLYPGNNERLAWPIGYYEITETVASSKNNVYSGTQINSQTFVFTMIPKPNGTAKGNTLTQYAPDGKWIFIKEPGKETKYNPEYLITLDNGKTVPGTKANAIYYHLEDTTWLPLGLYKVDSNLVQAGFINNNDVISKPEGDASYAGAQYKLFVTTDIDNNFFSPNADEQKNGGGLLSIGNEVTSVNWEDGLGNTDINDKIGTLYPVLYDGQDIIITTDENGIAKTDMVFPYSDKYRFVEIKAPTGYHINENVLVVQDNWTKEGDTSGTQYVDPAYVGDKLKDTPTVNGARQGAAEDDIYTYGFTGVKEDPYNVVGQGSATTNGIRFAVINRSDNRIVLNTDDITVDRSNVTYADKEEIDPGHVVAIVTTHTVDDVEGTFRMNGLPYGRYQIVELRHDATIGIDELYDGSSKLGSSIYANDGYLWSVNDTGIITMNSATQGYMYDLHEYQAYLGSDAEVEDTEYKAYNRPFIDGFQAYKLDKEYLQISEGDSCLDDIRYAVGEEYATSPNLGNSIYANDSYYFDANKNRGLCLINIHRKTVARRMKNRMGLHENMVETMFFYAVLMENKRKNKNKYLKFKIIQEN